MIVKAVQSPSDNDYQAKIQQQIDQYRNVANIHELPDIFHFWSNKYVRPRLNSVIGADSGVDFYANAFIAATARCSQNAPRFLSIGSGDCGVEINVAKRLIELGLSNFQFECLELSPELVARAMAGAQKENVAHCVRPIVTDINHSWIPQPKAYSAMMANHSLHHMVELERIFESVQTGLHSKGLFATNDMIGRNGHMRWPEVMTWIERIWPFLSERYKYNQQLKRLEHQFINWDCSQEGFEGIRAQDILPLLTRQFHFMKFLVFGGLIDVFVDRAFGHNFDSKSETDCALIDFIQDLNDHLIDVGVIKPTTIFAVMSIDACETTQWRHWSPGFSIRQV